MTQQPRMIKKYPNRRLYDTETSSYITLADVKKLVLEHVEFKVVDAKTHEDLTRSILLQIILEEETAGVPMFSSDMLSQIIRFYGNAMQGMMGSYLEKNIHTFIEIQKRLQDQSRQIYGDNPMLSADAWSEFVKMQGPAMQGLMGTLPRAERQRLPGNAGAAAEPDPQPVRQLPVPQLRRRRPPPGRATRNHRSRRRMAAARTKAATASPERAPRRRAPGATPPPKVGFVSLGCPKALVDSERILTQLRAEGYLISPSLRGRRPGGGQHLRLHRRRGGGIARCHRRGAGRKRQGDRHRLPRRQGRRRQADAPAGAGGHRPARHRGSDARGARASAAAARPVHRPGPAAGHQAHARALRLPEDLRRLQPPLHLLHHPLDARRPGEPPGRRGDAGGGEPGEGRREGTAGDLAGHQRLRRGREVPHRLLGRPAAQDAHDRAGAARWASSASGCGCTTSIPIRTWTRSSR